MKKDMCILNVFVLLFFSCFLTSPTSSKSIKYSNRSFCSNTIREDVEVRNFYRF
ncbi:hypothetical protein [Borreliella garinii]|uniref:hypothetical protein n=1 Tax=Borreliella garinii TaxID=29519 RepID=UPI001AEED1E9|nr:hypothetical protein [Borreliella garinii]